jgi:hypothetical protein
METGVANLDGDSLRVVNVPFGVTDLKGGSGTSGQVGDPGVAFARLGAQIG